MCVLECEIMHTFHQAKLNTYPTHTHQCLALMQPYWLTGHKTPSYLLPTSVNINKMKNRSEKSRHNFNFGGTNHCLSLTPLSLPFSNAKKEKKNREKEVLEEKKEEEEKKKMKTQRESGCGGWKEKMTL